MSARRQTIAERTPGKPAAVALLLALAVAGWRGCTSAPAPKPADDPQSVIAPPPSPQDPHQQAPLVNLADGRARGAAGGAAQATVGTGDMFDAKRTHVKSEIGAEIDWLERTTRLESAQMDRSLYNSWTASLQSQTSYFSSTTPGGLDRVGEGESSPTGESTKPADTNPTGPGGAIPEVSATRDERPGRATPAAPPAATNTPAPATPESGPPRPEPSGLKDAGAPSRETRSGAPADSPASTPAGTPADVSQPGGPGVGRPATGATAETRRDRVQVPLKVGEDDPTLRKLAADSDVERSQIDRPLPRFDEELWVISRPPARVAASEARRPPDAGAGTLWLGRGVGGRTATLREYRADATITGPISSVTVTQRFENELSETLDGVYVLPMPRDAAVTDFVMTVGSGAAQRRIRGVIRERAEAERIFLDAQRQGKIASLLDEQSSNLLVQRIANIESGASISTSVTYFGTLEYASIPGRDGTDLAAAYEFVLPMAGLDAGGASVAVTVRIEAGLEVLGVLSPTHTIKIDGATDMARVVTVGSALSASTGDFVLRYAVSGPTPRVGVVSQCGGGGTYFSMLITPPAGSGERAPLELVIIPDVSADTTPEQLRAIQGATATLLRKLKPTDRFSVSVGSGPDTTMVVASPEAVASAISRLTDLAPSVARPLGHAVRDALAAAAGSSRLFCVVAHGEISDGVQTLRHARANLGSSRIFALSIDQPAGFAFESLARIGRGGVVHVSSDSASAAGSDAILSRLLEREGPPIMTDLEIDWGGAEVADIFPRRLPDLSAGRPVHVVGRLLSPPAAGREIRVTGTVRGASGVRRETMSASWNAATPAAGAIPTLWARAKVLMIAEQLAEGGGDPDALRRELVDLALRHNLISALTAFIAVDALSSVPARSSELPRLEQANTSGPR